jgi:hypothetical protein
MKNAYQMRVPAAAATSFSGTGIGRIAAILTVLLAMAQLAGGGNDRLVWRWRGSKLVDTGKLVSRDWKRAAGCC